MYKKGRKIFGIIICTIAGILLHFVYEWSGNNKIAGYISAVNESTWEHLKLLFIPVLFYTLFEYLVFKEKGTSFLFSRTLSLIMGMFFIVTAFYTISGIVGKTDMPAVNIGIYVIGVFITFLLTGIIEKSVFNTPKYFDILAITVLLIFLILFIVFTYNPANIGLFKSP